MPDENKDMFQNDLASRYGDAKPPVTRTPGGTWQEHEREIAAQITNNPDDSVASFVWNFDGAYVSNLTNMLRGGRMAEAKKYYDDMCRVIENNRGDIQAITQLGDVGGPTSKQLAERASRVFQYGFNDLEVKLPDGTAATVGQMLADGSNFLETRSRDLVDRGFSEAASQMYLSGDDLQRRTMSGLMNPFVDAMKSGRKAVPGVVPNHGQLVELADDVAANWDVIAGTFGDGTQDFVNYIRDTHQTSGGASATMRALTELAMNSKSGLSGKDLVRDVKRQYDDLLSSAMGGDDAKGMEAKPMSDSKRREFDAVLIPSIRETLNRVGTADLSDPRFKTAVRKTADALAAASAAGIDIFSDARKQGRDVNADFASYVADCATGMNPSASNLVTGFMNLRDALDVGITGGRDPQLVMADLTGDSQDYIRNADRANRTKSLCPAADGMALEAKNYLLRAIVPHMVGGHRADDALSYIFSDENRRSDFMSGLTDRISNFMHGKGRDQAAAILANAMVGAVSEGRRVNVQEVVENLINDPGMAGTDVHDTLSTWYHGNVANAVATAQMRQDLVNHYRSLGYTDLQTRMLASKAGQRSSAALAAGQDPSRPFRAAMNMGIALVPKYNSAGELEDIVEVPGNMNKVGFKYGGQDIMAGTYASDPDTWAAVQKVLANDKKRLDQIRMSMIRGEQSLERSKEMADYRQKLKEESDGF